MSHTTEPLPACDPPSDWLADFVAEPPPRDPHAPFALPVIESGADVPKATAAISQALASGEISDVQAERLTRVVGGLARALVAGQSALRLERPAGFADVKT